MHRILPGPALCSGKDTPYLNRISTSFLPTIPIPSKSGGLTARPVNASRRMPKTWFAFNPCSSTRADINDIGNDEDFISYINHESLKAFSKSLIEPALSQADVGEEFQCKR